MQVKEIMSREVKFIDPQTTLKSAAEIMREKNIGILPIGAPNKLEGVITDRDIITKALAKGLSSETPVNQIMSTNLYTCQDNDEVEVISKNMGEKQIRRLPVLNQDKNVVGMVSLGDVCTKCSKSEAAEALEKISKPS